MCHPIANLVNHRQRNQLNAYVVNSRTGGPFQRLPSKPHGSDENKRNARPMHTWQTHDGRTGPTPVLGYPTAAALAHHQRSYHCAEPRTTGPAHRQRERRSDRISPGKHETSPAAVWRTRADEPHPDYANAMRAKRRPPSQKLCTSYTSNVFSLPYNRITIFIQTQKKEKKSLQPSLFHVQQWTCAIQG